MLACVPLILNGDRGTMGRVTKGGETLQLASRRRQSEKHYGTAPQPVRLEGQLGREGERRTPKDTDCVHFQYESLADPSRTTLQR